MVGGYRGRGGRGLEGWLVGWLLQTTKDRRFCGFNFNGGRLLHYALEAFDALEAVDQLPRLRTPVALTSHHRGASSR